MTRSIAADQQAETVRIGLADISLAEVNRILDKLDLEGASCQKESGRQHERYKHRRPAAISIDQHHKRLSFVVWTRSLSACGLGFLHRGVLLPGTCCTVGLKTTDGLAHAIRARVAHCRHIDGALHEVGVVFETPVDPVTFSENADRPPAQRP